MVSSTNYSSTNNCKKAFDVEFGRHHLQKHKNKHGASEPTFVFLRVQFCSSAAYKNIILSVVRPNTHHSRQNRQGDTFNIERDGLFSPLGWAGLNHTLSLCLHIGNFRPSKSKIVAEHLAEVNISVSGKTKRNFPLT